MNILISVLLFILLICISYKMWIDFTKERKINAWRAICFIVILVYLIIFNLPFS